MSTMPDAAFPELALCGRLFCGDVELPIPRGARPAWPNDHPHYTQGGDRNIWAPFEVTGTVDDVEALYRTWSLARGYRLEGLGRGSLALWKDGRECRIFVEPIGQSEVVVRICVGRIKRYGKEATAEVASYAAPGMPPPPAPEVAPPQPRIYDKPLPTPALPRARVWPPCVPDDGRPFNPNSAVWARGLVFTCDGDVVRVIDPTGGRVLRLAGGGSDPNVGEGPAKRACFRGVAGLAIDEAGLWFGDIGAGAVRRMHFASDSVSTLADGLPAPVQLARAGKALYVACRQGELFEIDTSTTERRPLEAVRGGAVTSLAIIDRTLYVATDSGVLFGIDRTSGRVTQRLEVDGMPHSIVGRGPRLYVGLPGRIEKVLMPDGSSEKLSGDGVNPAVTQPSALAIAETYDESSSRFIVTGLYFFDAGNLCWLDLYAQANNVTTVLAGDQGSRSPR